MQKTNSPAVYVDLDDVIAKTTCHYTDILKRELGKSVDFEEINTFNLQESFSLTDAEYDYFFKLVHTPEIILGLKPMEGAVDVLNRWKKLGVKISVVTGRLTSTYDTSLEWLKSNKVPFDSFIMVDKYSRPGADKNKAISLEDLSGMEFVLAVEDSFDMAQFLCRKMNTAVILFDKPWNRNAVLNNGIQRLSTWKEIGSFFKLPQGLNQSVF